MSFKPNTVEDGQNSVLETKRATLKRRIKKDTQANLLVSSKLAYFMF
jgi:hypothetical protein